MREKKKKLICLTDKGLNAISYFTYQIEPNLSIIYANKSKSNLFYISNRTESILLRNQAKTLSLIEPLYLLYRNKAKTLSNRTSLYLLLMNQAEPLYLFHSTPNAIYIK